MKTFLLAGVVAASASLGMSAVAAAAPACKTSFLLGTWLSTDLGSGNAYCLVQFKKNGWIVRSSCPDLDTLTPEATLTGRFNVKTDCSVSGDFEERKGGKKKNFVFTGTMQPNKGIVIGEIKAKGQPAVGYRFVQQY